MLRFQLLELSYWSILAATKLKQAITLDKTMGKITASESQSVRLLNALALPANLENEARTAAKTRNYLAHRFLRNLASALQDEARCEEAVKELAVVGGKLDEFQARLEAYMRDLRIPELSQEELADLGLGGPQVPEIFDDDAFSAPSVTSRTTVPDDIS